MKTRITLLSAYVIVVLCSMHLQQVASAQIVSGLESKAKVTLKVDPKPIDRSTSHNKASFANILSKTTPAVVGVYTSKIIRLPSNPRLNPMEEFLRRYYGLPPLQNPSKSGGEERVPAGIGSGVIVSPEGYVLTNAHVITDQRTGQPVDEVTVKLANKRELIARIIGLDKATDVAVLKIDSPNLPQITLADSDQSKVGDIVFAAGNPLGVGLTVTMGIVSATGRTNLGILEEPGSYEHFIQTDAAINMGNSGGALIDSEGRLVGINTAIYSRTGGNIGIGFAIPINLAKSILVSLVEKGNVDRGFLGVELEDITPASSKILKVPTAYGARVSKVVTGSPADKAGLKVDDVVVSMDERPVQSVAELRVFISRKPPGEEARLGFFREGKKAFLKVTLGRLKDKGSAADSEPSPFPGLNMEPLSDNLRLNYEIPKSIEGIIVTKSSGEVSSLREGVVVVEINGHPVSTIKDARKLVERGLNRLYVWFRGRHTFVPYRIP